MNKQNAQAGYIALLAVLIVGAASVAIALALLMSGTDSQRSMLIMQQSLQARNSATACAEEALQQIHDNTAFTGTANLTLSDSTCSYTVTNTGGSNRTIDANTNLNGVARKVQVYVIINPSSISIVSWQEIS